MTDAREKALKIARWILSGARLTEPAPWNDPVLSAATDRIAAALQQARAEALEEAAEAMREAVLQIGPTVDDLKAVGMALMKHTSIDHLTNEELGAAAFDASLRLAGAFKKRVRAISLIQKEPT